MANGRGSAFAVPCRLGRAVKAAICAWGGMVAGAAHPRGDRSLPSLPWRDLHTAPIVDEPWLCRDTLARCQAMGPFAELFAILRQPRTGVLQEAHESQAHEELRGTAAGTFSESRGDLLERVGPLTPAACGHQRFKGSTVAWDGWIEPGVICRPHGDHGPHLGLGLAQDLPGTLFHMRDPLSLAPTVGGPLHGTIIVDATPTRSKAVTAHGEPRGTEGHALGIDLHGCARGCRVLPPTRVQGDDRRNGFGLYKVVDTIGIQAAVIDHSAYGYREGVGGAGLQHAIQAARAHGEIRHMAGSEHDLHRQGMLRRDDTVLEIAMAKEVRVAVRVIAPGRRRIAVEALVVATEDALRTTRASGSAVGTRAGGQAGAIAAEDEGLQVTEEPTLG